MPLPTHQTKPTPPWRSHARRIAFIYAGFALLWILASDHAVFYFLGDTQKIAWVNTAKGAFFVLVTTILLWHLMRRMLIKLEKSQAQLRALIGHLENAREEERTRISREVHDVLGQLLTGVKMNLKWITQRIPSGAQESEKMVEKLSETDAFANAILASIQEIAHDLRPGILDRLGLIPALRFETERFHKRTGIACQFNTLLDEIVLPPEMVTHVFRIVQEMLTNVARHASASMVTINLVRQDYQCVITVADNGVGISEKQLSDPSSLGLLGMTERAKILGGDITIKRGARQGTTASFTFYESQ